MYVVWIFLLIWLRKVSKWLPDLLYNEAEEDIMVVGNGHFIAILLEKGTSLKILITDIE